MQLNKIPATVVTGFLGSGKTTLLSNLLKQANGKRIAVIVNEFGELDIDADLLRNCPLDCDDNAATQTESGIYELANGCICCTVEEEFLPVMQKLVERRDQIDHILIETSGLALPKPLVQAFNWPDIKQFCTVDAVITVVDGPAVAAGRFAHDPERVEQQRLADDSLDHNPSLQELLDDQLSSADLVVISKSDCLDENARAQALQLVQAKLPERVKTLFVANGEVDSQVLIGLEAATEERIEAIHTHHDHHHDHGHHHRHAHDDFDSCVITLGAVDSDKLLAITRDLISANTIYRVKGFVANGDKPMRQVVQAVGDRIAHYFDRLWGADEDRKTRLVFIGQGIDASALRDALSAAEV
ncbi:cobalamin biosynthesis protein CobW [Hahella sp. KA22]|uniref:cobalamin biosynthesis protein CobW n=1 Tax=Hahella sp. KA22 TaxID=1628392 RepID=UPI000FDF2655|nr:cobalamin biosynthesis protein CobW [Hahella sp. KA22]AZZ94927.1 cobalamin biosynthesis protein CobW [Hahella sp. KA22]QAY52571.1 cobalamin biosynthesis protein CobW [Hahella sp. KA22]